MKTSFIVLSIFLSVTLNYYRALQKTQKSRLATEVKAEFTEVNEHFAEEA